MGDKLSTLACPGGSKFGNQTIPASLASLFLLSTVARPGGSKFGGRSTNAGFSTTDATAVACVFPHGRGMVSKRGLRCDKAPRRARRVSVDDGVARLDLDVVKPNSLPPGQASVESVSSNLGTTPDNFQIRPLSAGTPKNGEPERTET